MCNTCPILQHSTYFLQLKYRFQHLNMVEEQAQELSSLADKRARAHEAMRAEAREMILRAGSERERDEIKIKYQRRHAQLDSETDERCGGFLHVLAVMHSMAWFELFFCGFVTVTDLSNSCCYPTHSLLLTNPSTSSSESPSPRKNTVMPPQIGSERGRQGSAHSTSPASSRRGCRRTTCSMCWTWCGICSRLRTFTALERYGKTVSFNPHIATPALNLTLTQLLPPQAASKSTSCASVTPAPSPPFVTWRRLGQRRGKRHGERSARQRGRRILCPVAA